MGNNKKNTNQITMKTFATFALLGLAATAIKLRDDGDDWIDQDEYEVGELAYEIADEMFDFCDADFDGVCTLEEATEVMASFEPEDEFEAEIGFMTELIFDNANNWHYWDEKEADGVITYDELAVEAQWGIDHNDLEEWYEDALDGEFDYEWMDEWDMDFLADLPDCDWDMDLPDCDFDDQECWDDYYYGEDAE